MPTMKDLGIDRLSLDERVELINEIWASVEAEADAEADQAPLTDAQRAELERRLEAYRLNPDAVVPWEEVYARAMARARR